MLMEANQRMYLRTIPYNPNRSSSFCGEKNADAFIPLLELHCFLCVHLAGMCIAGSKKFCANRRLQRPAQPSEGASLYWGLVAPMWFEWLL